MPGSHLEVTISIYSGTLVPQSSNPFPLGLEAYLVDLVLTRLDLDGSHNNLNGSLFLHVVHDSFVIFAPCINTYMFLCTCRGARVYVPACILFYFLVLVSYIYSIMS